MKVAIISDIHDNSHNLVLFFLKIEKLNIDKIIFLGDFINNGIAKMLAASKTPVFAIWGNNDGDKVAITKTAMSKNSNLEIGDTVFGFIEIDNKKIFLTHYANIAKSMAKSGDFDAVFYGHNHKKNIEVINNCLLVNPGEISAHKTSQASFAVYDSEINTAELFKLEDSVSVKTNQAKEYIASLNLKSAKVDLHRY